MTADFNISSALRWAIQDQWSSGFTCGLLVRRLLPHESYACCKNAYNDDDDDDDDDCFAKLYSQNLDNLESFDNNTIP